MDDGYTPDTIDASLIPKDPTAGWNPLSDTIYSALTETLSLGQLSDIQNQTAADIARDGANFAAASRRLVKSVNDAWVVQVAVDAGGGALLGGANGTQK